MTLFNVCVVFCSTGFVPLVFLQYLNFIFFGILQYLNSNEVSNYIISFIVL